MAKYIRIVMIETIVEHAKQGKYSWQKVSDFGNPALGAGGSFYEAYTRNGLRIKVKLGKVLLRSGGLEEEWEIAVCTPEYECLLSYRCSPQNQKKWDAVGMPLKEAIGHPR